MLGNREKMVVISSSTSGTNEWPQNNQIVDEKSLMMASTSSKVALSQLPQDQQQHHQQQQQQQQQQALKCPRCDSSNTKFCYYNNYSLSQPRHFCKACKRYWTRGGTLRNVPVGGGCRKNKRVKRPAAASSNINDGPNNNSVSSPNPNPPTPIDINPLFYGLTTNNPSELNLPIFSGSRFNSRVESAVSTGFHDLQPQLNALALGFSSGIQDVVTSNSLLSSYSNLFGSSASTNTSTTSPTIASLLASSLHQHKFTNNGAGMKESSTPSNHFQSLTVLPVEDLQISGNSTESGNISMKGLVKVEQDHQINRLDHHWANVPCHQNQIEQIGFSSDPSPLYWNTSATSVNVGSWHHDPTNIGSSVTSLI